jgi:protein TonB
MRGSNRLKRAVLLVSVLLFAGTAIGGIVMFIQSVLSDKPAVVKQIVQEVKIIRPPPPPPELEPPPPQQEEVDIPRPEEQQQRAENEPAPGEQLGLDADASGAGDGFGLLARKGGRDLLASGEGAFAWYTGIVQNAIRDRLQDDDKIRASAYSIVVRIWMGADGAVEKVRLAGSTGDHELDASIERALANLPRLAQAPPIEMPQPLQLRIVSRI